MNNEIATKADLVNLSKDISQTILENNLVLFDMMDKEIKDNNNILVPLMGKMMDEKIKDNNNILVPLMGKMMDEKIKDNNNVLVPLMGKMMDEKIKDNNNVLIPLMGKMIKDNNNVLIPLMGKMIKDNNEYIFSEFNNQTERILNLFRGVIKVNKDGAFSVSF